MKPLDWEEEVIQAMRDELNQLLADALGIADRNRAEMTAAQVRHDGEMVAEQNSHEAEMHNMDLALASRDVIGQAKGIIMVTMRCTADDAFRLLIKQSQAENCKLVEIATQIAHRVSRRAAG